MPLMDLIVNWTWLKKEPLSLRISQKKLPRLKTKRKKTGEKKQDRIAKNGGTTTKGVTCA